MPITQTDLDALDAAIATSELEVELEGRRVRYRSTAELLAARAHVAAVLTSSAGSPRRRVSYAYQFTTQRGD